MKSYFFVLMTSVLLMAACTHAPVEVGGDETSRFERRNTEKYFVSSGAIQYFLSELPSWANTSIGGQCHRDDSIKYMNYKKLMDSFAYDYSQAVQFQYSYNIERRRAEKKGELKALPFKNQEKLFFGISDRIESNIKAFRTPSYKRVHLIWIDPALGNDKELSRLKAQMKTSEMDQGFPVFVTFCLYHQQLIDFIQDNNFRSEARLMTYEMLNPYSPKGELTHRRYLAIDEIFSKEQKIILYLPKGWGAPPELAGSFQVKTY